MSAQFSSVGAVGALTDFRFCCAQVEGVCAACLQALLLSACLLSFCSQPTQMTGCFCRFPARISSSVTGFCPGCAQLYGGVAVSLQAHSCCKVIKVHPRCAQCGCARSDCIHAPCCTDGGSRLLCRFGVLMQLVWGHCPDALLKVCPWECHCSLSASPLSALIKACLRWAHLGSVGAGCLQLISLHRSRLSLL